ncbi:MAG: cyclase family protein [Flavobacteriales bacterium]|nr:cyclase family protein [Flavobacteriales bacterium]
MIATIEFQQRTFRIDLSQPIDISIPLRASADNVTAWYVNPPEFKPVMEHGFVGDVNLGGSVNFRNIFFNPHGHGTHTECVGHISKENYTINQCLKTFTFLAKVISISPEAQGDDRIITMEQVKKAWNQEDATAIIIRTLPNGTDKLSRQYSNTNPAYIHHEAMQYLVDQGVEHVLIDTPSVDREEDGGALLSHHIFWNYPENTQAHRTITEMIYVPDQVADGEYLLQFQIASFENDASPSKPVLYAIL